ELVDAVRRQGRDESLEVARVLGQRMLLVELPDVAVELGRHFAPIDLEHGRVGHRSILQSPVVDIDVVFLGTAASMPTAQRSPAALLVRRGSERLLFDCGEGTQRQLQRSAIGLPDLQEIFLTHFHADHFLGLPGMLKTFALRGREETPLTVYGPRGLRELFKRLHPFVGRLPYPLTVVELEPGERLERAEYVIEAFPVEHGPDALGYAIVEPERPGRFDVGAADALGVPDGPARGRLQGGDEVTVPSGRTVTPADVLGDPRPGRKIVLTGDTAPSPLVVQAAHNADLLVHEASFLADEEERA